RIITPQQLVTHPLYTCSAIWPTQLTLKISEDHPDQPSFPTRRSSDLRPIPKFPAHGPAAGRPAGRRVTSAGTARLAARGHPTSEDRKSTRLNSSHVKTSYAVFCLKKKNANKATPASQTVSHRQRAQAH